MVTDAFPEAVGSAALTAVTVTVAGDGTDPGAVYSPDALILPVIELPPTTPFTFHVTD